MQGTLIFFAGAFFGVMLVIGCIRLDRYEDRREREFSLYQRWEEVVDRATQETVGESHADDDEKSEGAGPDSAPNFHLLPGGKQ